MVFSNGPDASPVRTAGLALLVLLALLLAGYAYADAFSELFHRWSSEEEYSHGYLIPLLAIYFAWERRDTLGRLTKKPSFVGAALVAISALVMLVGEISALYILVHYSIILMLLGFAVSTLGVRGARSLIAPIMLLVFCIPIPYFLEAELTAELQLISSKLGVAFLRALSVPVFLDGNVVDLGTYKLQVVEACSGLNYLYPLLGIGFICTLFFKASHWKNVALILSVVPITILLNSFRIGTVGLLVREYGPSAAEGFLHDFQGWLVFLVCLVLLAFEMYLLGFKSKPSEGGEAFPQIKLEGQTLPNLLPLVLSLGIVLFGAVFSLAVDKRLEIVPARTPFMAFPRLVGEWVGTTSSLEAAVIKELKLDDYLLAQYSKDNSATPVELYIAYYGSQRKGASPHSPKVCLPGGGWEISEIRRSNMKLESGLSIPTNQAMMRKGNQGLLVHYWFQQRGRIIANEYAMKWYLLRDAMELNRTDGSLVRVVVPISDLDDPNELERAQQEIDKFVSDIWHHLPRYLPI